MAFNKGDVVMLQTGKLKQFFRVQRDAGKDSTQVEDIFGVWAPAGGSVYVQTSKVKKVSPSDIRTRRVYVDVISPSVKDWQHRAEVARSIKRDIQGLGVMDFVPTREADLEFNCPAVLAEDVKKLLHPTHFNVEINSRKSTDKVVSNALEYGDSKACNDATDADKRALKGEMGKLIKCFTGVFEVMKRIDQARAEKAFGSFANISSLFRRELM